MYGKVIFKPVCGTGLIRGTVLDYNNIVFLRKKEGMHYE